MKVDRSVRWVGCWLAAAALSITAARGQAGPQQSASCKRVSLEGEVSAGREWKTAFGQGWVFRVLPIRPGQAGYTGWDLVVDQARPAGYPDALLLATMPYNSISEREIGTTFGLRAQDAIGWNPRTFRFLLDPTAFREGQQLFQSLFPDGQIRTTISRPNQAGLPDAKPMDRLLRLQKQGSPGEFRILDARLTPGVADPAPYAQNWAFAASRTPHEIEAAPSGKSTARGSLNWIRFSVTLWLPGGWNLPAGLHGVPAPCP